MARPARSRIVRRAAISQHPAIAGSGTETEARKEGTVIPREPSWVMSGKRLTMPKNMTNA
jgi:hypothetical protein